MATRSEMFGLFYKPGDRVKIRAESEYYGQCDDVGTVGEVIDGACNHGRVDFDSGYHNSYRYYDLELVEPKKKLSKAEQKLQEIREANAKVLKGE